MGRYDTQQGDHEQRSSQIKFHHAEMFSPPPPPPPPLPYPASILRKNSVRENDRLKKYAADISSSANAYRSKTKECSNRLLENKIEELEESLEIHKGNELTLQSINYRLQKRLALFQKQNQENILTAKQRISELKEVIYVKQTALSLAIIEKGKREDFLKKSVERQQKSLSDLCHSKKIADFRYRVLIRKAKESKARVLCAWACTPLLRKICEKAVERRHNECASRCWNAWKRYCIYKRFARERMKWAQNYFDRVVLLRRVFLSWRNGIREIGRAHV
jgi:hypothetical protein